MNESEVAAACDKLLEDAGWMVVKTSDSRQTRRQLAGLPDRICFRKGMTLLIEYKSSERPEPRESQILFRSKLYQHLAPTLEHFIIMHPDALPRWAVE